MKDLAQRVVERVGPYEVTKEAHDLDCTTGDLEQAYNRGWNAALIEVRAAIRREAPATEAGRDGK